MLSHPANQNEPEEASVATATSLMRKASANRRRHSTTVSEVLAHFDKAYFRDWFVEGPKLLLKGCFSRRAAGFMIASATPAILTGIVLTVPGLLFDTPEHKAYFHFARILEGEAASAIPVILGTISSIFSFRLPLG
ncbi:MAG: hypothetical protein B9S38_12285 [Verrucomicrobiia bacterium Tous-C4TDCM]|jgi:hypothetical protein|nr:MAG: hypothetical protein B9S38_12285 [Verrucomicrobiae bacterium Tous-C4TDCM]